MTRCVHCSLIAVSALCISEFSLRNYLCFISSQIWFELFRPSWLRPCWVVIIIFLFFRSLELYKYDCCRNMASVTSPTITYLTKLFNEQGNTAVYLLYAHARICSIIRKSGKDIEELKKVRSLPSWAFVNFGICFYLWVFLSGLCLFSKVVKALFWLVFVTF